MKLRLFRHKSYDSADATRGKPLIDRRWLILIGVVVGVGLGLYYAWIVEPVVYESVSPARFGATSKEEYIFLVSQSYAANNDWSLAQERLSALEDANIQALVEKQLEAYLRSGQTTDVMRNLSLLAERLGANSVAIDIFLPEVAATSTPPATLQPTPERTRSPSRTPIPTIAATSEPSPTPFPKYRLLRREQVCHPQYPVPRLEVEIVDSILEPTAGIEVIIQWNEGIDHFFTGFHSDRSPGYGDFEMEPDVVYQVQVADGSPVVDDLKIEECGEAQGGLAGGWRLTFQDTDVPQ